MRVCLSGLEGRLDSGGVFFSRDGRVEKVRGGGGGVSFRGISSRWEVQIHNVSYSLHLRGTALIHGCVGRIIYQLLLWRWYIDSKE